MRRCCFEALCPLARTRVGAPKWRSLLSGRSRIGVGAITLDAKVIVLAAPRALIVVLATGSGQVVRVVRAQVRATASAWSSHPLVLPEGFQVSVGPRPAAPAWVDARHPAR